MDALITSWDQPDFSSQAVGGKARALAHAAGARFNIPAWIVVLPSATERLLIPGAIDLLTRGDKGEPPKEMLRQSLSTDAVDELLGILRQKLPDVTHFAVRSSAVDEDSQTHSFAGQLDSFLNVPLAEVPERIVDVWCSGFSERVYLYRQQNRSHERTFGLQRYPGLPLHHPTAWVCLHIGAVKKDCAVGTPAALNFQYQDQTNAQEKRNGSSRREG